MFSVPLDVGDAWQPSPEEQEFGLRLMLDPSRGKKAHKVIRLWPAAGVENGVAHRKGDPMLTWQVISKTDVATYDMKACPKYAQIGNLLEDARERVRFTDIDWFID